ncbi:MAG: GntR family transcriptional regulator, partial [Firmicutes bacterium]|nr:GntR family transcriptional regulator [Bacillota bacterium]
MGSFKRVRYEDLNPLSRQVFDNLRKSILEGKLAPGVRLVERRLAEEMGTSRTPVREALGQLELEGLVYQSPRRGMVVAGLSREEIEEIFKIRAVLEGLAARLSAGILSPAGAARLLRLAAQVEEAASSGRRDKLHSTHLRLHEELARSAGSPRLFQMIHTLREYVGKFTEVSYEHPGRLAEALREHREIIEAIRDGCGPEAEEAMKRHIVQSEKAFLEARYGREAGPH